MSKIQILDCTLRDGGYCNAWEFGNSNIKTIISNLTDSNIDMIECGFLSNKIRYDEDISKFTDFEQIAKVIPEKGHNTLYVAMINYGEYNLADIPEYDGNSIDGIRVAFHKKERFKALEFCNEVRKKGYKTFVQAMVSLNYSDEEFLEIIRKTNEIKPYAFYIVDSFGNMKNNDLIRLFYLVEHNLDRDILIGFHSHNNMQLAYSNALSLAEISSRDLIIDSSVYGMGRGAGNLNTELFVEYLNLHRDGNYKVKPLLTIIDDILNNFHEKNYWGYSLPNYISAKHNAHPNYAGYLSDKNTLTFEDIDRIFAMMSEEKKVEFDKSYVEELYIAYLSRDIVNSNRLEEFKKLIENKDILLIAPGSSSENEKDKIKEFVNTHDCIAISINFDYQYINTDFIFVSNIRRFKKISNKEKCIITSNIDSNDVYMQVDYNKLLNPIESVKDNAGIMAIKFLLDLNAGTIYLAGFDGYSHESSENYMNQNLELITKNIISDSINKSMTKVLGEYKKNKDIIFLTSEHNIHV